jgi:hypothetical protein
MNKSDSLSLVQGQSTVICMTVNYLSQLPHWLHQLPTVGGQCNHKPAYWVSVASLEENMKTLLTQIFFWHAEAMTSELQKIQGFLGHWWRGGLGIPWLILLSCYCTFFTAIRWETSTDLSCCSCSSDDTLGIWTLEAAKGVYVCLSVCLFLCISLWFLAWWAKDSLSLSLSHTHTHRETQTIEAWFAILLRSIPDHNSYNNLFFTPATKPSFSFIPLQSSVTAWCLEYGSMLKQHQNQLKLSRKAEDIAAWWQVQLNGR